MLRRACWPPTSQILRYISGSVMVATFWPTVGTVGLEGGGAEENKVFMVERRVVLPALSRPRRRIEYSDGSKSAMKSQDHCPLLGGIDLLWM